MRVASAIRCYTKRSTKAMDQAQAHRPEQVHAERTLLVVGAAIVHEPRQTQHSISTDGEHHHLHSVRCQPSPDHMVQLLGSCNKPGKRCMPESRLWAACSPHCG